MNPPHFIAVTVQEETQPGSARREAARLAAFEGMDENDVGRVSLVVTEAAKNLIKHGRGGEMLLQGSKVAANSLIDMLALDKGMGMNDVDACMRDGFSTAGTSGTGLGAMRRVADKFEIYSSPGGGTAVYCQVASGNAAERLMARMETGVVMVPIAGETKCGDGWAERHTDPHSVYMVVDGLGHGVGAAEAAQEAMAAFERIESVNPVDILDEAHHSLRRTRGAAMSVASIDHNARKVRYAGIGNVAAAIVAAGKSQSMVSHNGIVGHSSTVRIQEFTYDWPVEAALMMYSDGITSQSNLLKYPGLLARSPLLAAGVIYRDFSRRRDDSTVLIARERAARN